MPIATAALTYSYCGRTPGRHQSGFIHTSSNMDIIKRNFFRLLRSGALNEYVTLEPMTTFKWNRLFQMAASQNVVSIALKGIKNHQYDTNIHIPQKLILSLQEMTDKDEQEWGSNPHLSNPTLNKRLKKIKHDERHAIDTSMETLQLLDIIIFNVNHILAKGISVRGIIELGSYLRTRGDKVDFVKLETWLTKLHLQRMAQLQGSILIVVFNFEQDEIPFVENVEREAYPLILRTLTHTEIDTTKEWHFRESKAGFVQNNNKVLRRNLRRSMRYINYSPIETSSHFIANLVRSLSEIEE